MNVQEHTNNSTTQEEIKINEVILFLQFYNNDLVLFYSFYLISHNDNTVPRDTIMYDCL